MSSLSVLQSVFFHPPSDMDAGQHITFR